jgi:cob(I)alamin adenosyltransferase
VPDKRFSEPRLALNRVYTRRGDSGETALVGGQRIAKDHIRIEAYGTIDELNSFIGIARESVAESLRNTDVLVSLGEILLRVQHEIDEMNEVLPPLRSFVLPGGCRLNAELHVCRTVCRRAERICVTLGADAEVIRYLNRLSDAMFVWSRWASHQLGVAETLWEPNRAAAGSMPHPENS